MQLTLLQWAGHAFAVPGCVAIIGPTANGCLLVVCQRVESTINLDHSVKLVGINRRGRLYSTFFRIALIHLVLIFVSVSVWVVHGFWAKGLSVSSMFIVKKDVKQCQLTVHSQKPGK